MLKEVWTQSLQPRMSCYPRAPNGPKQALLINFGAHLREKRQIEHLKVLWPKVQLQ